MDVIEAFDGAGLRSEIIRWSQDEDAPKRGVLEGFIARLALEALEGIDVKTIYLDAPHELRFSRRQGEMTDKDYEANVLIPMHNLHVEAQKTQADLIVDVSDKTPDQVEFIVCRFMVLPQTSEVYV